VRTRGDTLIRYQEWALGASDSLHLDVADRWARYDQLLLNFAEGATDRLQVAVTERDELREQIRVAQGTETPESEIADLRLRLAAVETRIGGIAGNIASVSRVLERRGFETAAYQEALIRATGDVTSEVLDPGVLVRLARSLARETLQSMRRNAGTVLVRLLIVAGFIVLFRVLFGLLWRFARALRLVRGSHLIRDLVGRLLRPVATLIGLYVGLSVIGVQTTTLLAGLGIAGLVVGFALQDSLSNLFAGIAILASHAYDVDDIVEVAGVVGKVRAMGLWNTTIVTFDSRRLLIPNKSIWGANVENRSVEVNRRVDCVARIGYETDLQAAIALLEQLLRDDPRVLEAPAPRVWVSRLDESWVEVKLWPWVKTEDWWSMYSNLPRLVRLKLAEAGIDVPVPRRDVTTRPAGPPEETPPTDD
jgi:small conductance mechanosensitive channel